MISIGLGQILGRDDGREPILCALNETGSNTKVVNESKEKVAKWEDECRKVITHYKSILTSEMKDYVRERSNPKEETSRERLRVIRSLIADQFNTPTSDRVDFARNKVSQLPKVYDYKGLCKNLGVIRDIKGQLLAWSNLDSGPEYRDLRLTDDTCKTAILKSVSSWSEMNFKMRCLREDSNKQFSSCVDELIKEAQRIDHDIVMDEQSRHQNPQLSVSMADSNEDLEEEKRQYEAFVARTSLKGECYNCGQVGHGWFKCEERMDSCFKCQTTFSNVKDYHHPKDCKKIKPNSGLKKRPIGNAEMFKTSQKQKQGEPGSFNKKRIFQGSAATAWTPSQGGVIQNKHSGEWELLGPLQKKFTVKAANFNDSNSEDEDEGELLNPSNRNI